MNLNTNIGLYGQGRANSNIGLTGCYNICGITHFFNRTKREECRARCDKQFDAEQQYQQQQQEMLEQIIADSGSGGLSTGAILGIVGGILALTIAGVIIIRKTRK